MRRTLVIALGTAACGSLLHFRRCREAELRGQRTRLRRASPEERPAIEQRIQRLSTAIRFLAVDLDGTDAYRLPPPLETDGSTWQTGETFKVSLHPRDVLDRFQSGQLQEVEQVNPETLRGLDAENSSGGARPNSDLAFCVAGDRIRSALREALVELLKGRQALTATRNHGIRVLLLAGTFGGTGSGSFDRVKHWLLDTADDLGVQVDVYPILLVPGAHGPKDPANSYANTFAVSKELAADATGYYWRSVRGAQQRSGFRAPFYFSDINDAFDIPRLVSESAGTALAGEMAYLLSSTLLGAHLDAQIGDYGVAGTTPTLLGEPRQARSIGIATIFLDFERQELWSRSRIVLQFIEQASTPAGEGVLRQEVRTFLEAYSVVLGDGREDLANHLLSLCSREHLSLTRIRSMFALAVKDLPDARVLVEGRNRLDLALQNAGDFGPALDRHAAEFGERIAKLLLGKIRNLLTDSARGPASAGRWLAIAGGVTDAMLASAGNDLAQLQAEVTDLDAKILRTEAECQEALRGRGRLYRALHSAEIAQRAATFRSDLEYWATTRIRAQAMSSAMQVLNQVRQTIHEELQETTNPVTASLAACAETVREDQRRAAAHSLEFGCPNGLPLLGGEGDLSDLHSRCFPAVDEASVIAEFYTHLSKQSEPAAVLKTPETLYRFFAETAPVTLLGARLAELNVVDELKHRFPDEDSLGSVLRERDLEAYERLPLASTSEQTSGLTLVRLLGVDGSRIESIRGALEKHQTDRSVRYLPVDTGDRQRITFMQIRAVFPFSDWRAYPMARAHYESLSASSESERQHILPGNRFLPTPGCRLTESDLVMLLVRGWVLGRLDWDQNRGWAILPATESDPAVSVAPGPALAQQTAWRLAVDLVSSTNCFVRRIGPDGLRKRLEELEHAMANGSDVCGLKLALAQTLVSAAVRNLRFEADWWERNSHPAGNGWQGARVAQ